MTKTYTLRFAAKNKQTFEHIQSGRKSVETRAATIKYLPIKVGDTLVMSCAGKKLSKTVKNITKVKSIAALLKKYKPGIINSGTTTLQEMEAIYYSYPGYEEKIKEYGILAFELE